jgi:hypothetical protein
MEEDSSSKAQSLTLVLSKGKWAVKGEPSQKKPKKSKAKTNLDGDKENASANSANEGTPNGLVAAERGEENDTSASSSASVSGPASPHHPSTEETPEEKRKRLEKEMIQYEILLKKVERLQELKAKAAATATTPSASSSVPTRSASPPAINFSSGPVQPYLEIAWEQLNLLPAVKQSLFAVVDGDVKKGIPPNPQKMSYSLRTTKSIYIHPPLVLKLKSEGKIPAISSNTDSFCRWRPLHAGGKGFDKHCCSKRRTNANRYCIS